MWEDPKASAAEDYQMGSIHPELTITKSYLAFRLMGRVFFKSTSRTF